MKVLILIFALIAISSAHHFTKKTPAEIKAGREDCWKELNVSDDLIETMKKYEYPDVVEVHKAVKCTGIKFDVWCEEEGFHKKDLVAQFGEGATSIFDKCISTKSESDTPERWAWHDWKCFIDNGLKDHFPKGLDQ